MLRTLGVEDEVRGYSTYKPGATFGVRDSLKLSFFFNQLDGSAPPYAYNVPRDRFDQTLLDASRQAGARVVEEAAGVERVPDTDRIQLTQAALVAAGLREQPDWIVDATGRVRLLPNLLGIQSQSGPRKDVALFAHVDRTDLDYEGHVHTTRLEHGWSWRIPLPGRVSVGIVIGSEFLPRFGATEEEQYDNLLRQDRVLSAVAGQAKRLTPVMKYANYQLVSERILGENWVLVGDTAGFIDPVFSSGLFIGMHGAMVLADALCDGRSQAMQHYSDDVLHHLRTWHEIVEYFYNGRLLTCFHVGQMLRETLLVRLIFPHMNKHMGRIFSGAASTSNYSLGVLRLAMKYGLKNEDPRELMIN
jgi:flavin-dependent dehydrogenase